MLGLCLPSLHCFFFVLAIFNNQAFNYWAVMGGQLFQQWDFPAGCTEVVKNFN